MAVSPHVISIVGRLLLPKNDFAMLRKNLKIVLLLLTVILCASQISSYGQDESKKEARDRYEICFKRSGLLSDDTGKPIEFSAEQMKERATKKVLPPPAHFRGEGGYGVVKVLVNAEGKVECAVVLYGHPLIKVASERAAKQWTFEPFEENGESIAYIGLVQFHFKSGKVSY